MNKIHAIFIMGYLEIVVPYVHLLFFNERLVNERLSVRR